LSGIAFTTLTTSQPSARGGASMTSGARSYDVEALTIWRIQLPRVKRAVLPPNTSRPNPVSVGNRVFVSVFSPGSVLCLDRKSGEVIWRRPLSPFGGSQVLHVGSFLYAKTPHSLYCLESDTGRLVWRFSPYGGHGETMYSAPSVGDGRLFIGDRKGYLHALDADTGRPLWRVLTSRARNNDVNGPPLIHRDCVLVATNAGRVLAIDAATGSFIWNHRLGQPCTHEISVCPGALS
jgi:outer membrane protein assembly factor BamB